MFKLGETFFYYDKEQEYLWIEIYFKVFWKKKVIKVTVRKDYILELIGED